MHSVICGVLGVPRDSRVSIHTWAALESCIQRRVLLSLAAQPVLFRRQSQEPAPGAQRSVSIATPGGGGLSEWGDHCVALAHMREDPLKNKRNGEPLFKDTRAHLCKMVPGCGSGVRTMESKGLLGMEGGAVQ